MGNPNERQMITEEQILGNQSIVESVQLSQEGQTPIKLEEVDQWLDTLANSDD